MTTPEEYQAQIESLMAMSIRLQLELTKALESVAVYAENQKPKTIA